MPRSIKSEGNGGVLKKNRKNLKLKSQGITLSEIKIGPIFRHKLISNVGSIFINKQSNQICSVEITIEMLILIVKMLNHMHIYFHILTSKSIMQGEK